MRGFTLIETLLAFFVMLVGLLLLFMVFSSGARQAVHSRNHTVAMLYAESFLEEVRAHPYGQPEPQGWKRSAVFPVRVKVEGREQPVEFKQEVKYENQSFIGKGEQNSDKVTLKLTWDETEHDKHHREELVVQAPVWR